MKKTILIVLAILSFGISKAKDMRTAQRSDIITYKGTEYRLNSNPLEHYFEQFPDKRPQSGIVSTALWRGYIAYFEIIDNQLYVTDIKIQVQDKKSKEDYKIKLVSAFKEVFPNKKKFKIDWYSGILILPHGDLIQYVHMGYASTYSKYWLIEIDKGNVNETRFYTNKEFIEFKNRQFEQFKKTEKYKELFTSLKKSDRTNKELESFIKIYIIDYATKFLTD